MVSCSTTVARSTSRPSAFETTFRRAAELVRAGRIGAVRRVEIGLPVDPTQPDPPKQPVPANLDYDAWRGQIAASLCARGDTAVFSHYVAINAVLSHLTGDERVLTFRPDHASITILETDGRALTLVAKGREAATSVL